ncbi:MAG: ATP-dependent DNA helicase RecG, partial [Bacteroidales bacterium]
LQPGGKFLIFGKPVFFRGSFNIAHPDFEPMRSEAQLKDRGGLQPLYSSTEKLKTRGLHSKGIEKVQRNLIATTQGTIPENLPDNILSEFSLMPREEAFRNIHFPKDHAKLEAARRRLKFEELFFIQLRILGLKQQKQKIKGHIFEHVGKYFNRFYKENLPFPLTNAQKKVIKEIRADMASGQQMNRLLQGDVGSGKTLVALMNMLLSLDNGFQASLMAPTEILAAQHFKTITAMLNGMNIQTELLTGSTKKAQRKRIHAGLQDGTIHILTGTHALIEDTVTFKNLGFVVIDEQHRFGVAQRAKLWKKSIIPPHILVMTATPIPRTLAMTVYGDLDYSVIDELPPGRKPVKTYHSTDAKRLKVFAFMKEQIRKGRQIYVVYPLIHESQKLDLKDLMDGYESITREFPAPKYAVSIVHGQMKPEAKDYEMQRFVKGETQILISTTVIEVGMDVPKAAVMIIENAERFGLSQLHQLRGRVGRGADQSYCILMTKDTLSPEGQKRIATMVNTNDGFKVAEEDMKLRGPGDIEGTQQSGILELKISDIIRDEKILKAARNKAARILQEDSNLEKTTHLRIKKYLNHLGDNTADWSQIS